MADQLKQWLAQMPPDDVIVARISELETELAVWQTLRSKRPGVAKPSGEGIRSTMHDAPVPTSPAKPIRPLSPERLLIAKAMLSCRTMTVAPGQIAKMLRADGHNLSDKNVQVTMARMLKAGQLRRPRTGIYKLVPEIRDALSQAQVPTNGNGHAPELVISS